MGGLSDGFRPPISADARAGWNVTPFVQVNLTGRAVEVRAGYRESNLANDLAIPPHLVELPGHALASSFLADGELVQVASLVARRPRPEGQLLNGGHHAAWLGGGRHRWLVAAGTGTPPDGRLQLTHAAALPRCATARRISLARNFRSAGTVWAGL